MAKPFDQFGGWLRFFQVTQIITIVLYVVLVVGVMIIGKMNQLPIIPKGTEFSWGFAFVQIGLTVWILRFVTLRAPHIPTFISKVLIAILILGIASTLIDLMVVPGAKLTAGAARNIVMVFLWLQYFRTSKRVLTYYGANAFSARDTAV